MLVWLASLALVGIFGGSVYQLTMRREPEKLWIALIGVVVAILLVAHVVQPDDGCYVDWDGRANPTVCE